MLLPTLSELAALLPLMLPAIGGVWVLGLVAWQRDRDVRWPAAHSLLFLGLSAASAILLLGQQVDREILGGAIVIDPQGMAFHLVFILVAVLTVLSSAGHLQAEGIRQGEFFALVLFAVFGMSTMASSHNLLTIFLGLEILSICLYSLAGFTRDRAYAIEGALKYFLLGAFSTGFVLYGMALFYGVTGRIDLGSMAGYLSATRGEPIDPLILVGAALLLIGLAFKVGAVPFHFWVPDVYQGGRLRHHAADPHRRTLRSADARSVGDHRLRPRPADHGGRQPDRPGPAEHQADARLLEHRQCRLPAGGGGGGRQERLRVRFGPVLPDRLRLHDRRCVCRGGAHRPHRRG
jgi:NADH:ubiquinone oxidoreductase subunit 2 (subunit N)